MREAPFLKHDTLNIHNIYLFYYKKHNYIYNSLNYLPYLDKCFYSYGNPQFDFIRLINTNLIILPNLSKKGLIKNVILETSEKLIDLRMTK
ncbi:hypothetical protein AC477_02440 [miscellaneous Crenarchaeota group-1 archaeon SG8-32-1]|uniref:Uncharacterized protein n=1 Tax=miscellaneous Crenarchaeota group-1 archaeon SG8-32-1 TaxID=1685124 RepID=A0A0M0BVY8_9ARCH|nr:MAG: hypothetical protein AC477_02440 [miscellaneous Crenarchaeota group-1 archaeon SG8-32-1]